MTKALRTHVTLVFQVQSKFISWNLNFMETSYLKIFQIHHQSFTLNKKRSPSKKTPDYKVFWGSTTVWHASQVFQKSSKYATRNFSNMRTVKKRKKLPPGALQFRREQVSPRGSGQSQSRALDISSYLSPPSTLALLFAFRLFVFVRARCRRCSKGHCARLDRPEKSNRKTAIFEAGCCNYQFTDTFVHIQCKSLQ